MTKVFFLINDKAAKDVIDNGLFAYFPEDNYGEFQENLKTSYSHIGQHSACHVDYAAASREATPEEYRDLLAELIGQGYDDLEIMNTKEDDKVQVIGTIDMTPTWTGVLGIHLAARDNINAQIEKNGFHTSEQRETLKGIEKELYRMAELADRYVEVIKQQNN